MKTEVKFDYGGLRDALSQYERATKKEIPDILNRAGRNIAYRAANKTPKATATKIRADLKRWLAAYKGGARSGNGSKIRAEIIKAGGIEKFIAKRVRSAGYLRSGWAPAVESLGGKFRGSKGKRGGATKATVARFLTEIFNTVPGIEEIGVPALQSAINDVADDMIAYAQRKLQKEADKHSVF